MISLCSYSVEYVEDGPQIFPLDTDEFFISDDDNVFVIQATLDIVNSESLPSGVTDQLRASSTREFNVSGSGSTKLVAEAVGPTRYITTHQMMADFLRTVSFLTNDQAPNIVRNLSVLVEEFPIGDSPSIPSFVPIRVRPVNDQPVLMSSQRTEESLDNYLIQNLGFNVSFLLSPNDIFDSDQDLIGLAIINQTVPMDLGVWQYRAAGDNDWTNFPDDISLCEPLFVDPSTRIRFSPSPNPLKEDGETAITYQAWDTSSNINSLCSTAQDGGTYLYTSALCSYSLIYTCCNAS